MPTIPKFHWLEFSLDMLLEIHEISYAMLPAREHLTEIQMRSGIKNRIMKNMRVSWWMLATIQTPKSRTYDYSSNYPCLYQLYMYFIMWVYILYCITYMCQNHFDDYSHHPITSDTIDYNTHEMWFAIPQNQSQQS